MRNDGVNASDLLGMKIEYYSWPSARVNKTGWGLPKNEDGRTIADWVNGLDIGKVKKNGNCWTFSMNGKLTIKIKVRPGSAIIDNFGYDAEEHERNHERGHSVYWNKMAAIVNDAEGFYCNKQCADDARAWVLSAYSMFNWNSIYWNADYDIRAYGANRQHEKDKAAINARQALAVSEALRQRLLNNKCEVWNKCPQ